MFLFMIAMSSLLAAIMLYQAYHSYNRALQVARTENTRITEIFSKHAELTFLSVDLTLRRVAERQHLNHIFGNNLTGDLQNHLDMWMEETPHVDALFLTDSKGNTIAHSARDSLPLNLLHTFMPEQPAFRQLMENSGADTHVDRLASPASDVPYIILSRKIYALNGQVSGMAAALVNPLYFQSYYHSLQFSGHSQFMMFLTTGDMLAGTQPPPEVLSAVFQNMAKSEKSAPAKQNTLTLPSDYGLTIFSYEALRSVPVILSIATSERGFLAGWRWDRLKDAWFLAIFSIFSTVLSFFIFLMSNYVRRTKRSEESAVLASQAKSDFLAKMSHELRTPLNAIIGFSEMLNAGYFGSVNHQQKQRVLDIHLCATHLLQLINDILEFSKGEAGKLTLNEERLSLRAITEECIRILKTKARNQDIILRQHIADTVPDIWGDKRKLRQLLLNLLSNAIKFSRNGGTVTVEIRQDYQKNIIISVIDTGIGMREEDIPKALSVFGQVHRSDDYEGTGLGLPLARMLAELHDGKLELTSELGTGTSVFVLIPAYRRLKEDDSRAPSTPEIDEEEFPDEDNEETKEETKAKTETEAEAEPSDAAGQEPEEEDRPPLKQSQSL